MFGVGLINNNLKINTKFDEKIQFTKYWKITQNKQGECNWDSRGSKSDKMRIEMNFNLRKKT